MKQAKTELCYVVPYYSPKDDQHFKHLPNLLAELAKSTSLDVIVERSEGDPLVVPGATVFMQRRGGRLGRRLEFAYLLLRVRARGCRRVFVRISKGAALTVLSAGSMVGMKLYYWNSGVFTRIWEPAAGDRTVRRGIEDYTLRFVIRRAHRFVTGPESMVDHYVDYYGVRRERCVVVYNDVDLTRYRPPTALERCAARQRLGIEEGCRVVLSVTRVEYLKGGDLLEPVARGLQSEGGVQLVALGRVRPGTVDVNRQPGNLHVLGPMPTQRVLEYLAAADVFLLPSRQEGFPRSLLEAMACGLPCVATDVGGTRDLLPPQQRRYVVPAGDSDAMVSSIRSILRDPSEASTLGEANRQAAQRFSTERVAEMIRDRICCPPGTTEVAG